jgi:Domain of unknown function (DUF4160)
VGKIYYDESFGLAFYIFSNDHHPPHVHVYIQRKGNREDKGILKTVIGDDATPPEIDRIYRKVNRDMTIAAWQIVEDNQQNFLEEWQKHHGN